MLPKKHRLSLRKNLQKKSQNQRLIQGKNFGLRVMKQKTKRKGIHPFCVSIETNPDTSGRLTELYGKNHIHLQDVSLLPQKLINFYKRIAF